MLFKLITRNYAIILLSSLVACAPVQFSKQPVKCESSTDCVSVDPSGYTDHEKTVTVGGGLVDILFVDDNSGSMSFEQHNIAEKFPNLISELYNRNVDYRIAITTTDVSGVTGVTGSNTPADAKDGNIVNFGSSSYLTSSMSLADANALFKSKIKRNETTTCENFILNQTGGSYYTYCPSDDERAVYAANLVVKNNPSNFIRSNAHLAIVIISDEEARSGVSTAPLEAFDQPDELIANIKSKFPSKTLSAHVIVTNNESCKQTQDAQMNGKVKGSIGNSYMQLAQKTNGVVGSVCAENYSEQMGSIGESIAERISEVKLSCRNPENLSVTFLTSSSVGYYVEGDILKFNQILPANSKVKIAYKCLQD